VAETLEALANVGEFVGAIGVIVTIGYLAVHIRQNTKAVRTSSYHQAAEQTSRWGRVVRRHRHTSSL